MKGIVDGNNEEEEYEYYSEEDYGEENYQPNKGQVKILPGNSQDRDHDNNDNTAGEPEKLVTIEKIDIDDTN